MPKNLGRLGRVVWLLVRVVAHKILDLSPGTFFGTWTLYSGLSIRSGQRGL